MHDQLNSTGHGIHLSQAEALTAQEPPELYIDHATLYYGSPNPGISALRVAEETTVGAGIYLTSMREAAEGYALHRGGGATDPHATVYEVSLEHLKVANLCNQPMLSAVMSGYLRVRYQLTLPLMPPYQLASAVL